MLSMRAELNGFLGLITHRSFESHVLEEPRASSANTDASGGLWEHELVLKRAWAHSMPVAQELVLKRGVPYLGLCRGSQLLNVAMGGTLYFDIATETGCLPPLSTRLNSPLITQNTPRALTLNPEPGP